MAMAGWTPGPENGYSPLPELLVPTLSLGEPAPLDQSVTNEPPVIEILSGQATCFSYQVHDVGQIRSKGRATLCLHAAAESVVDAPVLDDDLAPGEATSISVQVLLTASASTTAWLLARPEGDALPLIGRLLRTTL